MESLGAWSVPSPVESEFRSFLGAIGHLDPSSLERQAGRIEAIADLSAFPERAVEVELLRARVAVLLANVFAILGRDSVAHAKRALRIAKRFPSISRTTLT